MTKEYFVMRDNNLKVFYSGESREVAYETWRQNKIVIALWNFKQFLRILLL
ncbi:MAG: hypothetical protein PVJ67_07145 [Candidatus Pacearchaeota archaeon]